MDFINHQLFIKDINVHIDPILPKKIAIITHGHADHARFGHDHVIATRQTIDIMKIRYGDKCAKKFTPLRYGQKYSIKNYDFTLHPAGHILGSAQVLIEKNNHRLVITGDYKVGKDQTCKNFKLVKCNTLITEATFGLPIFQHPDPKDEIQKLIKSVKINKHNCHIVGAYALGKAQRVMNLLRQQNYNETIYIHGSLQKLCEYYSKEKINIGNFEKASSKDKNFYEGKIIIAPPSALKDRWSRRFPNPIVSMASGWMTVKQRAKQQGIELPLVISDHSDWNELLDTINKSKARNILITHGQEDALVYYCKKQNLISKPLSIQGRDDEGIE
jgi:putative mRNA 3-end processing factor